MCFQFWNTDIYRDLNFTNTTNFQSLEVVDNGSETQLQVTENFNWIDQCSQGYKCLSKYISANLEMFYQTTLTKLILNTHMKLCMLSTQLIEHYCPGKSRHWTTLIHPQSIRRDGKAISTNKNYWYLLIPPHNDISNEPIMWSKGRQTFNLC